MQTDTYKQMQAQAKTLFVEMEQIAKGDPKKEKAVALAQNAIKIADLISEIVVLSRCEKKKIFQPKNRTPKKRRDRLSKIASKLVELEFAQMRQVRISQTPIPKFPDGWNGTLPFKPVQP